MASEQGSVVAGARRMEDLPSVAAFLDGLPEGLESYPEAEAKCSTVRELARTLPDDFPVDAIPEPLHGLLVRPPPVSSWISEARVVALSLAVRDVGFANDEDYLAWIERGFVGFFGSPLYRVLMAVASPASLARGAEKRWAALRRGTSRRLLEAHPNGNLARVDYPPFLTPRLYAEATVRGITVAYRMSRARDPVVRILEWTPIYYLTEVIYDRARGGLSGGG